MRCLPGPIRIAKKFIALRPRCRSVPCCPNMTPNDSPKLVHERLRDPFPVLFAPNGLGVDLLRKERPHSSVEPPVPVVVVWAVKPRTEPCWLSIWDGGERPGGGSPDAFRLPTYGANLETRVLRAQEDFVAVETKEDVSRILASLVCACQGGPVRGWGDLPTPGA